MEFEQEKMNFDKEKQQFENEKAQFSYQKKMLQERLSGKGGLQQMHSVYFKAAQSLKNGKSSQAIGMMNLPAEGEYMNEEDEDNESQMPYFNKLSHPNNNFDYYQFEDQNEFNKLEDDESNLPNKYHQEHQINPQFDRHIYNKNYYQDIPLNQNEYMNDIHREVNQEFMQNNDDSIEENRIGENQRYYHNDMMQEANQDYNYAKGIDPNVQFNKNNQYQNTNQNYIKEDIQNQYNSRQSRFKDISNGQQQYLLEMQRKHDIQNIQANPALSNSYYEMGVKNFRKQINPNIQQTNQYFGQNSNQPMNNEAQMAFNNSYQTQNFGTQFGEMSFKKEPSSTQVNMVSGSSTDRYGNIRNQGLHNYISAGQIQNVVTPSSAGYNSQTAPGVQDSSPIPNTHLAPLNKEYVGNPPTFHPYHHLQNSSQINSQNSIQTPTHNSYLISHLNNSKLMESQTRDSIQPMSDPASAQITPKIMASRYINYDTHMQTSFQFPIQREDSRERMNNQNQVQIGNFRNIDQNSFYDRNQLNSLQESQNNLQQIMNQRDSIEGQFMNSSINQNNTISKEFQYEDEDKDKQKENILKIIQEYQKQLESLEKTDQKQNLIISDQNQINKDNDEKVNRNINLEKYLTKQDKIVENENDELMQKKIEMKNKIKELFKQKRNTEEDKQTEKDLGPNKGFIRKQTDEMQTPKKNLDQSMKNVYGNSYTDQPPVPQYITGSMRKIRKSPPLAENEEAKDGDSPSSIIPNNYEDEDEKNKTVYRLKGSSIDMEDIKSHQIDSNPIKSLAREEQQIPQQDYEEDEFKPDPNLLERLNENMRRNDVLEEPVYLFKETEEQRKKRELRERIEKERELERQKLFQILNDPDNSGIYWGGEDSDIDNEEEQK